MYVIAMKALSFSGAKIKRSSLVDVVQSTSEEVQITKSALRSLHPHSTWKRKAAFQTFSAGPFAGKDLTHGLSGMRNHRVTVSWLSAAVQDKLIEITAMGPRECIYEETCRLIKKSEND
jgi:hypothetical protein